MNAIYALQRSVLRRAASAIQFPHVMRLYAGPCRERFTHFMRPNGFQTLVCHGCEGAPRIAMQFLLLYLCSTVLAMVHPERNAALAVKFETITLRHGADALGDGLWQILNIGKHSGYALRLPSSAFVVRSIISDLERLVTCR